MENIGNDVIPGMSEMWLKKIKKEIMLRISPKKIVILT